ncbi:MAG: hypothetical protein LBT00_09770 [Spirochaetaceae bacterium]|nr:hypothetical protein [Spirochaetaceae bacterium]
MAGPAHNDGESRHCERAAHCRAKQSSGGISPSGLLRRFAPRNDEAASLSYRCITGLGTNRFLAMTGERRHCEGAAICRSPKQSRRGRPSHWIASSLCSSQ